MNPVELKKLAGVFTNCARLLADEGVTPREIRHLAAVGIERSRNSCRSQDPDHPERLCTKDRYHRDAHSDRRHHLWPNKRKVELPEETPADG